MISRCFIYSLEDDRLYVRHLKQVSKRESQIKILYSIGCYSNCETEEICSCDRHNTKAIFIRSYSYVPHYVKIPDTFYWVNPKYNATNYEQKLFATDCNLHGYETSRLLVSIIPPKFVCDFSSLTSLKETKNHAPCTNKVLLCLK